MSGACGDLVLANETRVVVVRGVCLVLVVTLVLANETRVVIVRVVL